MQTTTDIGFRPSKNAGENDQAAYEKMKNKVLEEVKHTFRPEFLNRVDEVIVFHQLSREEIEEIVGLELAKVIAEVKAQDMHLEVTEDAKALLARRVGTRSSGRDRCAAPSNAKSKTNSLRS